MALDLGYLLSSLLHIDRYITEIIANYGVLVYSFLFLIIFLETGLVLTPFLPGDSLIFAAGAIAASGTLNIFLLFFVLLSAAILGDTANYWIGYFFGKKLLRAHTKNPRFVKKEYIDRTIQFYNKHGGKTIVLARFIPIIRTFAPFIAGMIRMSYNRFISYNILGGVAWVGLLSIIGYSFGNIPAVKENFSMVVLAIIIISLIPLLIEFFRTERG